MAENPASVVGLRCLVLDDEFLIALDIQSILEGAGAAEVVCAASADEALKAIRDAGRFDLAVLDLKLGGSGMTSAAVAAELARHKTPFVYLTGADGEDQGLKKFPRAPVVEKPFQAAVLLKALARALSAG